MIAADFRFEGFDAEAFRRLFMLFGSPVMTDEPGPGLLVIVRARSTGKPCASFVMGRGPVDVGDWQSPSELGALCTRLNAMGAMVVEEGAIEELTESAARAMRFGDDYAHDYVHHWLAIVRATRKLEDEGRILWWPLRTHLPIPTPAMIERALDLVLPPRRSCLIALFEGERLWTGFAIERGTSELTRMVGPDFLLEWAGPIAGDFRRDHRALSRAVGTAMAPVHLGIFAQRDKFLALLQSSEKGAWARAVAMRDVIIAPATAYVHVALGADALRAAGARAAEALGGFDVANVFGPLAAHARQRVSRVASVTNILGFNPLAALAARLRSRGREGTDED
jgi:hypothetical protein